MCTDMCVDMCADMCTDMCTNMCINMCAPGRTQDRHAHRPVHRGKKKERERDVHRTVQCRVWHDHAYSDHMPIGALLGICCSALAARCIGRHNVRCNVRHTGRTPTRARPIGLWELADFCWLGGQPSCLLYTSPSPRDRTRSRMPSSA